MDHSSKLVDDDEEEDLEVETKQSEEKKASTTQVEANEDNTITKLSIEQARSPCEGNATLGGSRYPSRVRKPLGEWWMNQILPPCDVEHANVVMHDEPHTKSNHAIVWPCNRPMPRTKSLPCILEMIEGDAHIQAQGQEINRENSSPCLPYILLSQHQPTKSCFDFRNPT